MTRRKEDRKAAERKPRRKNRKITRRKEIRMTKKGKRAEKTVEKT